MDYKKNLTKKKLEAIEKDFARLDLESGQTEHIQNEIISSIPWYISFPEIIDEFSLPGLRGRSRFLIENLNFQKVNLHLASIKKNTNNYKELQKGIFLLASMEDTDLSYQKFHDSLTTIANVVREEFDIHQNTLDDKMKIHLLIQTINEGKTKELKDELSYLSRIFDHKKGLPVGMGTLYLLVNERLGLPLYGINFPFHFILYYDAPDFKTYIDAYNSGVFLDKVSCDSYLELNGFDFNPDFYTKSSTISILKRIYANTIHYYRKTGNDSLREKMLHQLGILNKNEMDSAE